MKTVRKLQLTNKHNQVLEIEFLENEGKKNVAYSGIVFETWEEKFKNLVNFKGFKSLARKFLDSKNPFQIEGLEFGLMTKFGKPTTPYIFHKINNNWGVKIEKWLKDNFIKFGGDPLLIQDKNLTDNQKQFINAYLFEG